MWSHFLRGGPIRDIAVTGNVMKNRSGNNIRDRGGEDLGMWDGAAMPEKENT